MSNLNLLKESNTEENSSSLTNTFRDDKNELTISNTENFNIDTQKGSQLTDNQIKIFNSINIYNMGVLDSSTHELIRSKLIENNSLDWTKDAIFSNLYNREKNIIILPNEQNAIDRKGNCPYNSDYFSSNLYLNNSKNTKSEINYNTYNLANQNKNLLLINIDEISDKLKIKLTNSDCSESNNYFSNKSLSMKYIHIEKKSLLIKTLETINNTCLDNYSSSHNKLLTVEDYQGLVNQKNTCYINTILQSLFMTLDFRYKILNYTYDINKLSTVEIQDNSTLDNITKQQPNINISDLISVNHIKTNSSEKTIIYQLKTIFAKMLTFKESIKTYDLTSVLSSNSKYLNSQQDIQEFCRLFFQAIEDTSPNCEFIKEIFEGTLETDIQCLSCKNVSSTSNSFMDIQLPIFSSIKYNYFHYNNGINLSDSSFNYTIKKNKKASSISLNKIKENSSNLSLTNNRSSKELEETIGNSTSTIIKENSIQTLISKYLEDDFLKEDNKYFCTHCDKKVDLSRKKYSFTKLPKVLVLQLNRLIYDRTFQKKVKLDDIAEINDYIELKQKNLELVTYKLYSIVVHRGNSESGHYLVYCFSFEKAKWYCFNDEVITETDFNNVKENCRRDAYLLFYQKVQKTSIKDLVQGMVRQTSSSSIENIVDKIIKDYFSLNMKDQNGNKPNNNFELTYIDKECDQEIDGSNNLISLELPKPQNELTYYKVFSSLTSTIKLNFIHKKEVISITAHKNISIYELKLEVIKGFENKLSYKREDLDSYRILKYSNISECPFEKLKLSFTTEDSIQDVTKLEKLNTIEENIDYFLSWNLFSLEKDIDTRLNTQDYCIDSPEMSSISFKKNIKFNHSEYLYSKKLFIKFDCFANELNPTFNLNYNFYKLNYNSISNLNNLLTVISNSNQHHYLMNTNSLYKQNYEQLLYNIDNYDFEIVRNLYLAKDTIENIRITSEKSLLELPDYCYINIKRKSELEIKYTFLDISNCNEEYKSNIEIFENSDKSSNYIKKYQVKHFLTSKNDQIKVKDILLKNKVNKYDVLRLHHPNGKLLIDIDQSIENLGKIKIYICKQTESQYYSSLIAKISNLFIDEKETTLEKNDLEDNEFSVNNNINPNLSNNSLILNESNTNNVEIKRFTFSFSLVIRNLFSIPFIIKFNDFEDLKQEIHKIISILKLQEESFSNKNNSFVLFYHEYNKNKAFSIETIEDNDKLIYVLNASNRIYIKYERPEKSNIKSRNIIYYCKNNLNSMTSFKE